MWDKALTDRRLHPSLYAGSAYVEVLELRHSTCFQQYCCQKATRKKSTGVANNMDYREAGIKQSCPLFTAVAVIHDSLTEVTRIQAKWNSAIIQSFIFELNLSKHVEWMGTSEQQLDSSSLSLKQVRGHRGCWKNQIKLRFWKHSSTNRSCVCAGWRGATKRISDIKCFANFTKIYIWRELEKKRREQLRNKASYSSAELKRSEWRLKIADDAMSKRHKNTQSWIKSF